jgi:hypothetical protein
MLSLLVFNFLEGHCDNSIYLSASSADLDIAGSIILLGLPFLIYDQVAVPETGHHPRETLTRKGASGQISPMHLPV